MPHIARRESLLQQLIFHGMKKSLATNISVAYLLEMTLAEYIKHKGMTLADMAALLDCSVPTVSKISRGQHVPKSALLAKIQDVTGGHVTPNDFIQPAAA